MQGQNLNKDTGNYARTKQVFCIFHSILDKKKPWIYYIKTDRIGRDLNGNLVHPHCQRRIIHSQRTLSRPMPLKEKKGIRKKEKKKQHLFF